MPFRFVYCTILFPGRMSRKRGWPVFFRCIITVCARLVSSVKFNKSCRDYRRSEPSRKVCVMSGLCRFAYFVVRNVADSHDEL
ncbi:hypothetical protein L596_006516 [Steinernema carpocapsae]|uniref:Uncharacterized protein n=1 Tax=Steinernema carpocapsae TaxID=34508 RepID=A0A4V6I936_STECR|nr:hypothetical protein L596_006516 [Steinernema carpocapsae]